jgi:hypothetical protein
LGAVSREVEIAEIGGAIQIRWRLEHGRKIAEVLKHTKNTGWASGWVCEDLLHCVYKAIHHSQMTARSGTPAQGITKAVRIWHIGFKTVRVVIFKSEEYRTNFAGDSRNGVPRLTGQWQNCWTKSRNL